MSLKNNAPAFDFYPERWLAGVVELSDAEQIRYLRLLCHQWIREGLPADVATLKRLAGGPVSAVLLEKFPLCEDGHRRNRRLELVRQDQRDRLDAKRLGAAMTNAKRHGIDALSEDERALLARFGRLADGQLVNGRRTAGGVASDIASESMSDTGSDIASSSPPPTPHPRCTESNTKRESSDRSPRVPAGTVRTPTLLEVEAWAGAVMAPPECAECFHADHEARPLAPSGHWTDRDGNPVANPAAAFRAFATRWKSNAAERRQPRSLLPIRPARPADVSDVKPSNLREL